LENVDETTDHLVAGVMALAATAGVVCMLLSGKWAAGAPGPEGTRRLAFAHPGGNHRLPSLDAARRFEGLEELILPFLRRADWCYNGWRDNVNLVVGDRRPERTRA
jgi:hypothetical protein